MRIEKSVTGSDEVVKVSGRIDAITAGELEVELKELLAGKTPLIIDMQGVEYVSSAGLRVILAAHKAKQGAGGLTVRHVAKEVMEIFEITGFAGILTIQDS